MTSTENEHRKLISDKVKPNKQANDIKTTEQLSGDSDSQLDDAGNNHNDSDNTTTNTTSTNILLLLLLLLMIILMIMIIIVMISYH